MTMADYMGAMNAHYYASRDPLGADGDFTTAPEISQMFGEMIGIWIADIWSRAGRPAFHYVELGPGRGTLAADALRVMARFHCQPQAVHLVETSPVLAAAQQARIPAAKHHPDVDDLPADLPLIIIANEFFDALPIHQYQKTAAGWREHMVVRRAQTWAIETGDSEADLMVPPALRHHAIGTIVETAPVSAMIMRSCGARLTRQGGAMLAIDYGYSGPAAGDTLQALKNHRYAEILADPGEVDLTAHVDFSALADSARHAGGRIFGPVDQGAWLRALGIDQRLETLCRSAPDRRAELSGQHQRLVSTQEMGSLFKVMGIAAPHWPDLEGFGKNIL
ncbi:MAG TPA: SAM-dependent methyltransferase [Sphingopyxis sp.]|nr:SAM-dependent methyltransferase [Sphingopyxis sp.]